MKGIIGAICGDIIGSSYEGPSVRTKDYNFELLTERSRITDDSVHTLAMADWLLSDDWSPSNCTLKLVEWSAKYIYAGYGPMMVNWLTGYNRYKPYNSFGNGSAMRVSPIAWAAKSLEECLKLAETSAAITHNHPEGIKGAQIIAGMIWCYRNGMSKEDILKMDFVKNSGYDLTRSYEDIHKTHHFDCTCQGSVPEAIICWLNSNGYEDCVRKAVALAGDSDTQACIAGSIEAAVSDVPDNIISEILERGCCLDNDIIDVINRFTNKFVYAE